MTTDDSADIGALKHQAMELAQELVGMSVDDYREIAITLAGDPDRLVIFRVKFTGKIFPESPL